MQQDYPILEFDAAKEAVIEPARVIKAIDAPEHCVFCFFQDITQQLVEKGRAHQIAMHGSEVGEHPLYEIDVEGQRLAVMHPGVGAPLAAALLDEVIARGCRKFVACGAAGVLDPDLCVGHIIVPSSAIRDEGTSYHYLPPAREVAAGHEGVAAIEQVLTQHQCDYIVGKTWTTDAIYRETRAKVELRKAEGCLTVEMEAAAFFAVAQFRNVVFAQMLYAGDDVSGVEWDNRRWQERDSVRESLFWLAAEACLLL